MDYAKDIKEFIAKIAEELTMGGVVHYDKDKLCWTVVFEDWLHEYDDYIDLKGTEFEEKTSADLYQWQIDCVRDIQEASTLPDTIEAPDSRTQFTWMEDYIIGFPRSSKFGADADRALSRRRPFAHFIQAVRFHHLENEWYEYRDMRMQQYVAEEINLRPDAEEEQQ